MYKNIVYIKKFKSNMISFELFFATYLRHDNNSVYHGLECKCLKTLRYLLLFICLASFITFGIVKSRFMFGTHIYIKNISNNMVGLNRYGNASSWKTSIYKLFKVFVSDVSISVASLSYSRRPIPTHLPV